MVGNTWKVVLATAVIFGAGVVTGGLLVSYVDRAKPTRPKPVARHVVPLWPAPRGLAQGPHPEQQQNLEQQVRDFMRWAGRDLDLTPEQRQRIEGILRDGQERTRATWMKIAPELRKELEQVKAEIRAELTPDQRAKFDELLKQRQRRRPDDPPNQNRGQRELRPPRPAPPDSGAQKPPGLPPPDNP